MNVLMRFLYIALILCIPVTSVLIAENLVSRAPDLYNYEFTKSQVLYDINAGVSDKEMGEYFSDFMMGKEKEFTYIADEDRPVNLFNANESGTMEQVRYLLNVSAVILSAAVFIGTVAAAVFLYRLQKEKVRTAYKWSWAVYAGIIIGLFASIYIPAVNDIVFQWLYTDGFGADSLLMQLITPVFIRDWFIADFIISLIAMIVLGSVILRITRPKRMFW